MTQEITLALDADRVAFIKKHAEKTGTTVSEIVDNYLELLQKADAVYRKQNINPRVAAISGIVRKKEAADVFVK